MAFNERYQQFLSQQSPRPGWREEAAQASASQDLPEPSLWERLTTESRLAFMARQEVLMVLAIIAVGWAVFVSVRAVQTPTQTKSTAAELTPSATPTIIPTPLPTAIITTSLPDNPFLLTPMLTILTPTPTPRTNPWATLLPTAAQATPTPRVNPWKDLIPTVTP